MTSPLSLRIAVSGRYGRPEASDLVVPISSTAGLLQGPDPLRRADRLLCLQLGLSKSFTYKMR
jgi:hypothetical protein